MSEVLYVWVVTKDGEPTSSFLVLTEYDDARTVSRMIGVLRKLGLDVEPVFPLDFLDADKRGLLVA